MYCTECGKKNREEAKYCIACGTPLIQEEKQRSETEEEVSLSSEQEKGAGENRQSMEDVSKAAGEKKPFGFKLLAALFLCAAVGGAVWQLGRPKPEPNQIAESESVRDNKEQAETEKTASVEKESEPDKSLPAAEGLTPMNRPSLLDGIKTMDTDISPSVPEIAPEPDWSNIVNYDYREINLSDKQREMLKKNNFVVDSYGFKEFFDIYEENRYRLVPSFITVDSMTHTYHLYFAHLMKNTERDYLVNKLTVLSKTMLEKSSAQLEELKGSEWENAAKLNTVFFGVGAGILESGGEVPEELKEKVTEQIALVQRAEGIGDSITGDPEDFSQYIPRGYYEGDEKLEKYFKAMMWYGRVNFTQNKEVLDRAALLMTLAIKEEGLSDWDSIYTVTGFFAGASDDNGYYEYAPLISAAYGENADIESLTGNEEGWRKFHELTGKAKHPQINSAFANGNGIGENTESDAHGFRFMGQRFSIDEKIFQNLIYDSVNESNGEKRDLPSGLDIPAALGSETALDILKEAGEDRFPGYIENMENLRTQIAAADENLWNSSLYSSWLYMLRPVLEKKGSGYPLFMQSEEWNRKNLQSFLGSYTELKHDTVLYVKQAIAEMGIDIVNPDDRGYVEPELGLWNRMYALVEATGSGLDRYGLLGADDKNNLSLLLQLTEKLKTISEKELKNTPLTDEEYELIRTYGGQLEHFWIEVYKDEFKAQGGEESYEAYSKNFPASLVTDVATGFDRVLEMAIGDCGRIYVLVPVDGKLRIAVGGVYTYYEFPYEKRLTDTEWREIMNLRFDNSGDGAETEEITQPAWTNSFTCTW